MVSPARPTNCEECRDLAELNGDTSDCAACGMPRECSEINAQAWEAWSTLDGFGRDFDTMAGNPMPLRIEAIDSECARYGDPDAIRWRVLEIERRILSGRHAQARSRAKG